MEVGRSLTSAAVAEVLIGLFASRTVPKHIRSDTDPEFIASAIRSLAGVLDLESLYIAVGRAWESGVVESFNPRFRDELLNREIFLGLEDARSMSRRWRNEYNRHRPYSSLGYVPPAAYAASLGVPPVGAASLPPARSSTKPQSEPLAI